MLATAKVILSRVEMKVISLQSNKLAALHHELAVELLRWFADFAMEKHWHSSVALYQQLQGLIQIWYTAGARGWLNLGDVAAMEELARQIQSYVDAVGGKVQTPGMDGVGCGKANKGRGRCRGKGKKALGGGVPPPENDVSLF